MMKTAPRPSGACPTFFRALCRTAQQPHSGGYAGVGRAFAGHVAGLVDHEDDELAEVMTELDGLVNRRDDAGVLAWFDRELPRCMALIPLERRGRFVVGLYEWAFDDENNFDEY